MFHSNMSHYIVGCYHCYLNFIIMALKIVTTVLIRFYAGAVLNQLGGGRVVLLEGHIETRMQAQFYGALAAAAPL